MENDLNNKQLQILQVAESLFAEKGFEGTSIRDISKEANINVAMVSYYFGSKQKLYDAAIVKQAEAMQDFLESETDTLDPREVLRRYAVAMKKIHINNPTIMKFICREFIEPSDHFNVLLKNLAPRLLTVLSSALNRGMEQKIFREDLEINPTVLLWIGMVNFFYLSHNLHSRVIGPETKEYEDIYLQHALKIFLSGIERRPSA